MEIKFAVLLILAVLGDILIIFSIVLFYWRFFAVGLVLFASGMLGVCLFQIMKWEKLRRRLAIGLPVAIGILALVGVMFMFTYLHQVQAQQTFRVTVSWFSNHFIDTYGWTVRVEQLSYEELEDVWIHADRGGIPFPSHINPRTIDGHAQKEYGCYPQPYNITITWDGGSETFLFNHYPFEGLIPERISIP